MSQPPVSGRVLRFTIDLTHEDVLCTLELEGVDAMQRIWRRTGMFSVDGSRITFRDLVGWFAMGARPVKVTLYPSDEFGRAEFTSGRP